MHSVDALAFAVSKRRLTRTRKTQNEAKPLKERIYIGSCLVCHFQEPPKPPTVMRHDQSDLFYHFLRAPIRRRDWSPCIVRASADRPRLPPFAASAESARELRVPRDTPDTTCFNDRAGAGAHRLPPRSRHLAPCSHTIVWKMAIYHRLLQDFANLSHLFWQHSRLRIITFKSTCGTVHLKTRAHIHAAAQYPG
jgi:hypothetical protein